jgi:hypothetical protein
MGELVTYGRPETLENGHEIIVLDLSGDSKIMWDPDNEKEVEAAREQYDLLVKKGFNMFRVDKKGEKKGPIKSFEESAARIIAVPPIMGG